MDWDDITPKKNLQIIVGDDLSNISVVELHERVEALKGEVERIRAEIQARQSTKNAAEDIFKG